MCLAGICEGLPGVRQVAAHVFVEQACGQRLVGNALFRCAGLKVFGSMAPGYLVDTNVLSELMRDAPAAVVIDQLILALSDQQVRLFRC